MVEHVYKPFRGISSAGFTIVELLIVVVVIAILATITIVSYNGIQARASLASKTSSIQTITKKIASQAVLSTSGVVVGDLASAGGGGTLAEYGLGSMSDQIVIDTDDELALDGGDCVNPAIMTKKKICLGAYIDPTGAYAGHVVYWNDVEKVWKLRWFGSGNNSEATTPGTNVPTALH